MTGSAATTPAPATGTDTGSEQLARGVAVVGASERGIPWTANLATNLTGYGFTGPIWPVNPHRSSVAGRRCYPSVAQLPGTPGTGVVLLRPAAAVAACRQLVAAGCGDIVVVSNGFRETGTTEGRAHEQALREVFTGTGTRLFGPNCVGFASFHDRLCAIAQPMPVRVDPGPVSVVSQSGGLTAATLGALAAQGLGVDVCYSIGNGTVFGLAAAVRDALARRSTRVVCAVVESIDDPAAVGALAGSAHAAGKHLAVLLLGESDGSRRVAQSHTGAVVGEHRMVAAWLRRHGIPVAGTADELAHLANLLTTLGRPDRRGGALVATVSGGGASITGDLAARHGVPLATLAPETVAALEGVLPPGSYAGNPLDVSNGDAPAAYAAAAADPHVGTLIEPWTLAWPDGSDQAAWWRVAIDRVAGAGERAGAAVIVGSLFAQPVNAWAREYAARHQLVISADLDRTLAALGALYATADPASPVPPAPSPATATVAQGRVVTEAEGRDVLARLGLPIVAGHRCAGADEVVRVGRRLTGPLVLKLSAPEVGHRERVGGVRLGLAGEPALRAAAAEIRAGAQVAGVPAGEIGYLVQEMAFGPELLVGAVRDPAAGPTLTVAVGGWAAEAGATFGTLVLPASGAELAAAAAGWRLPDLLGSRRTAELVALLQVVADEFATGALSGYRTVEMNPVILDAAGPRIADVLMVV